ncbi:unnamed protein product [Chrysodeixis includens]|uniref:Uncharacterized protein n=1 Tax=Chrysodeixis includens TaxID=689277 RepID=A0A9N8KSP6_CHRIL|nr:unnamed protein product [Chrysodeixis includens]
MQACTHLWRDADDPSAFPVRCGRCPARVTFTPAGPHLRRRAAPRRARAAAAVSARHDNLIMNYFAVPQGSVREIPRYPRVPTPPPHGHVAARAAAGHADSGRDPDDWKSFFKTSDTYFATEYSLCCVVTATQRSCGNALVVRMRVNYTYGWER